MQLYSDPRVECRCLRNRIEERGCLSGTCSTSSMIRKHGLNSTIAWRMHITHRPAMSSQSHTIPSTASQLRLDHRQYQHHRIDKSVQLEHSACTHRSMPYSQLACYCYRHSVTTPRHYRIEHRPRQSHWSRPRTAPRAKSASTTPRSLADSCRRSSPPPHKSLLLSLEARLPQLQQQQQQQTTLHCVGAVRKTQSRTKSRAAVRLSSVSRWRPTLTGSVG